jgi:LysR family transcriptional activator of nhaA
MKWINYHHLIYFKEIAKHGSISKASTVLKVGQPALSSQLKSLEEHLGLQLFERKNRKMILTNSGKVVLEYATKIDSLGQELIQVVADKSLTQNIRLSLGSLDSIPKHLVCDIVDFAHKKTGCFLSIFEDSLDNLIQQLSNHQIELIISDKEVSGLKAKNIFCKKIVTRPVVAYAAPQFKDLKENFPYSLEGVPCLVPTSHSKIRHDIENYFHIHDVSPLYVAETQDTSLQKILAIKGDGVIFLPKFTIKEYLLNESLVKIGDLEEITSEYYLIYSKRIIENPALQLVIEQDFDSMNL